MLIILSNKVSKEYLKRFKGYNPRYDYPNCPACNDNNLHLVIIDGGHVGPELDDYMTDQERQDLLDRFTLV